MWSALSEASMSHSIDLVFSPALIHPFYQSLTLLISCAVFTHELQCTSVTDGHNLNPARARTIVPSSNSAAQNSSFKDAADAGSDIIADITLDFIPHVCVHVTPADGTWSPSFPKDHDVMTFHETRTTGYYGRIST